MSQQVYDYLPVWAIYLLTAIILFAAVELGYRLARRMKRDKPEQTDPGIGPVVTACLALLAFVMAFLVNYAVGNFNQRRHLVIQDANVISTAYLRAGYLDEPYRTESRALLSEYLDLRITATDPARLQQALARSEQIQNELWKRAELVEQEKPTPPTSIYLTALNDLINTQRERVNIAFNQRVPPVIVFGLYLVAFMTLFMVGMQSAYAKNRSLIGMVFLVLILSIVFYLIIDLDRAQQGLLTVSQQALIDLQRLLPTLP